MVNTDDSKDSGTQKNCSYESNRAAFDTPHTFKSPRLIIIAWSTRLIDSR